MLKIAKNQADQTVIDRCEELLKMAQAGEVIGLAVVTINQGREVGECFCGKGIYNNVITAIGALEVLKTRILISQVELESA